MTLILQLLLSMVTALLAYLCGKFKVDPVHIPETASTIMLVVGATLTFSWGAVIKWAQAQKVKTAETINPGSTTDKETATKVQQVRSDSGNPLPLLLVATMILFGFILQGCASTTKNQIAQGYILVDGASKYVGIDYVAGTIPYSRARQDLVLIQSAQGALDAWDSARAGGDVNAIKIAADAANAALLALSTEYSQLVTLSKVLTPPATQPGG